MFWSAATSRCQNCARGPEAVQNIANLLISLVNAWWFHVVPGTRGTTLDQKVIFPFEIKYIYGSFEVK